MLPNLPRKTVDRVTIDLIVDNPGLSLVLVYELKECKGIVLIEPCNTYYIL